jgi:site-specific recombinase XerD
MNIDGPSPRSTSATANGNAMKLIPRVSLPPFAQEYVKLRPRAKAVTQHFHVWLQSTYRPIKQLEPREVAQFIAIVATSATSKATRALDCRHTQHYLRWLHQRQLLHFDPESLWSRARPTLPPTATRFVQSIEPTLKPSTLNGYRAALGRFHAWLSSRARTLDQLERSDTDAWLQWLHHQGLHANTRLHAIQDIRRYLRWLDEQGSLTVPADSLLRRSDLPKLPQYLPRPLPPDLDVVLQKRLRKSRCRLQLGLLLMRNTGLRIGELLRLSHRCVRVDAHGNSFLKVPLGKLDTERLVPLAPKILKLVRRLQRTGGGHRAFLLESSGRPIRFAVINAALRKACHGLSAPEPITSHRLRHTYATALLSGGMSLVAIMRLLGHRDYRMTLRYAAITDETVFVEYTEALRRTSERYVAPVPQTALPSHDPLAHLLDLIRFVEKRAHDDALDLVRSHVLVKRIRRLHSDIKRLFAGKRRRSARDN